METAKTWEMQKGSAESPPETYDRKFSDNSGLKLDRTRVGQTAESSRNEGACTNAYTRQQQTVGWHRLMAGTSEQLGGSRLKRGGEK